MTRTTTRPEPPHATGYAVHPYADLLLPEPEHDAGAMAPAGQLWTTVADLARWTAFLRGSGWRAMLCRPRDAGGDARAAGRSTTGAASPGPAPTGLGLQIWNSGGERSFGHGGSMPGFLADHAYGRRTPETARS